MYRTAYMDTGKTNSFLYDRITQFHVLSHSVIKTTSGKTKPSSSARLI